MKTLRSNTERARTARIFMIIMAATSLGNVCLGAYQYYFFENIFAGNVSLQEAEEFDFMMFIIGAIDLVI